MSICHISFSFLLIKLISKANSQAKYILLLLTMSVERHCHQAYDLLSSPINSKHYNVKQTDPKTYAMCSNSKNNTVININSCNNKYNDTSKTNSSHLVKATFQIIWSYKKLHHYL